MNIISHTLKGFEPLPEKIISRLQPGYNLLAESRLGGIILEVEDRERGPAILKIGKSRCAEDLRNEVARLNFLSGRLPVPEIFIFIEKNGCACLLISKLQGTAGHVSCGTYSIDNIIQRYAESLQRIHCLAVEDNSMPQAISKIFSCAEKMVSEKKINCVEFEKATSMTPVQLLNYLEKRMGDVRENIFTHGDYCLPNIILNTDTTSVIDWGQGAISNINRDFMSVELSIRMNFGEGYIKMFYDYYHGETPNPELIQYFLFLDQFEKYQME